MGAIEEGLVVRFKADTSDIEAGAKRAGSAMESAGHKMTGAAYQARYAVIDLSHVLRDLPYAMSNPALLAGPFDRMFQAVTNINQETGNFKTTLKTLGQQLSGGAGIMIGFNLVSSAIAIFAQNLLRGGEAAETAAKKQDDYAKSVKESFSSVAEQAGKVEVLVAALYRENLSQREKIGIIKELQSIAPTYFANLDAEKAKIVDVTAAYDRYVKNLRNAAEGKVLEKQLDTIIERKLELEKALNPSAFAIDPNTGRKIQNYIYEDLAYQEQRKKNQAEYNGLKQAEEVIANRIAQLKPPEVTKGDLKPPPLPKIDVPKAQKDYTDVLNKIFREMQLPNLKIALVPEIRENDFDPTKIFGKRDEGLSGADIAMGEASYKRWKAAMDKRKKDLEELAQTVSGVVSPAFQNMFSAIVAGENPIKAFFSGIMQGINQLISQLIEAAAEAAILSLLFPGGGSFGAQFQKIMLPGYADGLDYVPYDNYVARLHQGEMVLTAAQASAFRNISAGMSTPATASVQSTGFGRVATAAQGPIEVFGQLRGGDIVLSNVRTARRQGRGG